MANNPCPRAVYFVAFVMKSGVGIPAETNSNLSHRKLIFQYPHPQKKNVSFAGWMDGWLENLMETQESRRTTFGLCGLVSFKVDLGPLARG